VGQQHELTLGLGQLDGLEFNTVRLAIAAGLLALQNQTAGKRGSGL
jgi:hypothetical protein